MKEEGCIGRETGNADVQLVCHGMCLVKNLISKGHHVDFNVSLKITF